MKINTSLMLMLALFTAWPAQSQTQALRSAVIIGLSQYGANTGATTLEGVPHDVESAKRIAAAMGIPANQIRLVRDQEATKEKILQEIRQLGERTRDGGRSFIYFSGHGTRYWDPAVNGCVEGLLTHDGQAITNAELAQATQKVTAGADKVITMIDACHSGGVTSSKAATRSIGGIEFKPKFTFKASSAADACSQPSNLKTRSLLGEATRLGALQENVVQITSSRPDEVSFDEPGKGGLATQGVRDCLLGKAVDKDGSGAVSLAEIQQCAQSFIDLRLKGAKDLTPHHVSVSGNRNLIPVAVQRPTTTQVAAATPSPAPAVTSAPAATTAATPAPTAPARPPATMAANTTPVSTAVPVTSPSPPPAAPPNTASRPPSTPVVPVIQTPAAPPVTATATPGPAPATSPPPAVTPAVTPAAQRPEPSSAVAATPPAASTPALAQATPAPAAPEPMLASLATLTDIEQQRDPRIVLDVKLSKSVLKIGKDALDLSIKSSHDGYIYMVLLGSDRKSFYVLYPNGLDKDNRIKAGQTRRLPRPDWQLEAAGPPGTDHLLVMVSSSPRQIDRLTMAEPSATNPFTFALNEIGGRTALINFLVHNKDGEGSERFGAKLLTLKEVL
ncbi:caspase family protein [Limnohabitans sp. Hippo3]|uniref:caspase family protein n=1 Tax=Limnohabitans sp. Hippo3 TaxID=1597956 RepID=UPI001304BF79|nr:caspase family protein [Limnohabitans sp. Hippo3]